MGPGLDEPHAVVKAVTALNYAVVSLAIMFVNKFVLTVYEFPSSNFIAALQFLCCIVALKCAQMHGSVSFPPLKMSVFKDINPLPLFYMFNCLTGLASTKKLSVPMFTVLRRFSIVMTMALEAWALHKRHSTRSYVSVGHEQTQSSHPRCFVW